MRDRSITQPRVILSTITVIKGTAADGALVTAETIAAPTAVPSPESINLYLYQVRVYCWHRFTAQKRPPTTAMIAVPSRVDRVLASAVHTVYRLAGSNRSLWHVIMLSHKHSELRLSWANYCASGSRWCRCKRQNEVGCQHFLQ